MRWSSGQLWQRAAPEAAPEASGKRLAHCPIPSSFEKGALKDRPEERRASEPPLRSPLVRPPPSIPPAQGSGDIAAVGRVSEAPPTPEPALGSVIYWKRIGHRVGSGIFPSSPCFGGSQVGGIVDACRDGRRYFALGNDGTRNPAPVDRRQGRRR